MGHIGSIRDPFESNMSQKNYPNLNKSNSNWIKNNKII
jgi:hypothetical protein